MELYGFSLTYLLLAIHLLSLIAGIVYCLCKRSLRQWWAFVLISGACLFEGIRHFMITIAYDDIADPNYGTWGGWTIPDFILSDAIHLLIWTALGLICCFGFQKNT